MVKYLSHMLHVSYIYLQNWVIIWLLGQMLVCIFQHHGSQMGMIIDYHVGNRLSLTNVNDIYPLMIGNGNR